MTLFRPALIAMFILLNAGVLAYADTQETTTTVTSPTPTPTATNSSTPPMVVDAPPTVTSSVTAPVVSTTPTPPSVITPPPTFHSPTTAPVSTQSTTTVTQSTATSAPKSTDEFEQWLQSNGYQTNGSELIEINNALISQAPSPMEHAVKPAAIPYERGQQIMQRSAPPIQRAPDPDATVAFNNMLQQNMPLTPDQVVKLRQQIDVAQRAASIAPNVPPKPVSSTIMMNLAPGTTPPAVRLAQGYVTSLVFVDSTSAPWPIAAFDIGNPKAVSIQWDHKSNILLIQAIEPYSDGDIVIRLVGLSTPITLELVSGQRVVDYRADIHVAGIGPNAKDIPVGTSLPASANQMLLGVLDGVAPAGSRQLNVVGADAQAWLLGQAIFLRTRLTLLSPGWIGKIESPDGMVAYELPQTSSILVSRYGEPVELKIEGL